MLIMIMGLPGSGKSYFAQHLSHRIGAKYVSSDYTRKEMGAMGHYEDADKKKVYGFMERDAEAGLLEGKTVILDATFYKSEIRKPFYFLADKLTIPVIQIWLEASETIIQMRVSKKREESEADFEAYKKLAPAFEAPSKPYLKLSSTQDNIEEMLEDALGYLKMYR